MATADRQACGRPIDAPSGLSSFGSKLTRTCILRTQSKSQVELGFVLLGRCAEVGSTVRLDAGFFSGLTGVKDGNQEQQITGESTAQPGRWTKSLAIHETRGNGGDKWFRYGGF